MGLSLAALSLSGAPGCAATSASPAPVTTVAALQPAAARPAATIAANYALRSDAKVRVRVVTNARNVRIRYLSARQDRSTITRAVTGGAAIAVLRRGSHAVKARTVANDQLRTSGWVRARPVVTPAPGQPPTRPPAPADTTGRLVAAASKRVLFGHQSVGQNLLDAVPGVYARHGLPAPEMLYAPAGPRSGGFLSDTLIGENGNPNGKVDAFEAAVHADAANLNVALMKFCYVDITQGTDVSAVFAHYRSTMADLSGEFPRIKFLYVTAPLTTGDAEDNVAREQFNQRMRAAYGASGRLFDLAALESTRPDGSRVGGTHGGTRYYSMYTGYTDDGGHLNDTGAARAALALMKLIGSL